MMESNPATLLLRPKPVRPCNFSLPPSTAPSAASYNFPPFSHPAAGQTRPNFIVVPMPQNAADALTLTTANIRELSGIHRSGKTHLHEAAVAEQELRRRHFLATMKIRAGCNSNSVNVPERPSNPMIRDPAFVNGGAALFPLGAAVVECIKE